MLKSSCGISTCINRTNKEKCTFSFFRDVVKAFVCYCNTRQSSFCIRCHSNYCSSCHLVYHSRCHLVYHSSCYLVYHSICHSSYRLGVIQDVVQVAVRILIQDWPLTMVLVGYDAFFFVARKAKCCSKNKKRCSKSKKTLLGGEKMHSRVKWRIGRFVRWAIKSVQCDLNYAGINSKILSNLRVGGWKIRA